MERDDDDDDDDDVTCHRAAATHRTLCSGSGSGHACLPPATPAPQEAAACVHLVGSFRSLARSGQGGCVHLISGCFFFNKIYGCIGSQLASIHACGGRLP